MASKDSDERGTPADLIRKFHRALGGRFDLDPAAGAEPIPIADERYTKQDNGLARDWNADSVGLNPPYSDPKDWMRKVQRELDRDDPRAPEFIVALMRGDCSTEWFQHYGTGEYLGLVADRLEFTNTGDNPRSSNFLIGFGDVPDAVLNVFEELGAVYRLETASKAANHGRLDDLLQDGGVAVRASATGPTPGLGVSLDRLSGGDQPTLDFETEGFGALPALPERATVEMLPEGRSFDAENGEIRVNCLGANALPDGTDLYLQARESAYSATRLKVAVASDMRDWQLAPVEMITPTQKRHGSGLQVVG